MSQPTTEILLIRHAEAGDRDRWQRPDALRPLDDAGRRQALALVGLFADRRLVHLLSSPYLRCVQTMEPLAAAFGLSVETSDDLAEGRPWELVEKLALEVAADGPSALCVHGDVMRALIGALRGRAIDLGATPDAAAKGSTWILAVRDDVIVSARHVPPPEGRVGG